MSLPPPEVTLAITPVCPHCPVMLEVLGREIKKGGIAALHIINIGQQTDYAQANNIRSVPWLKIGPFILQGLHSPQEIETWLTRAQSEQGMQEYFTELLSNGELATVTDAIKQSPDSIRLFVPLLSSDETNINVRLGMGAILEDLAGQPILDRLLDKLIDLLQHGNARVRGDATHFLSFIKSSAAVEALQTCLNDPDQDVREIAAESLEALSTDPRD